jgi:hypothetical protein
MRTSGAFAMSRPRGREHAPSDWAMPWSGQPRTAAATDHAGFTDIPGPDKPKTLADTERL